MEEYWTVCEGVAVTSTTSCRECSKSIPKGSRVIIRDGRKIRLFYHPECFSGTSDPRTQTSSSYNDPRYPKSAFSLSAPAEKGHGKWSTSAASCVFFPQRTSKSSSSFTSVASIPMETKGRGDGEDKRRKERRREKDKRKEE
jgi:hypothetical protein